MWDPLGMLVITFVVMSFISIMGVALMYLIKNQKVQKGIFYFLSIWSMIIAYCSVLGTPEYMFGSVVISWLLGALGVTALLLQLCVKKDKAFLIAKIMVTVSVIAGMFDCFMI